jgi:hypothetical protein
MMVASCDTGNNVAPVFEQFFIKYYGEDGNQESVDMLINPDGTMVLLGNTTTSQTTDVNYPFIVKVDPLGNVLWQRRMGDGNEKAVDVEVDNQGNLIVVSNIGDESISRIRLFRLDQNGQGIDSLKIEMGERQVARSVTQASDNSYLIAGYAEPNTDRNPVLIVPPIDEADIITIRVDPTFTNVWITSDLGGGEHVGGAAKVFEATIGGITTYLIFGDSDRPADQSSVYKRALEVIGIDEFGVPNGIRKISGNDIPQETQIASTAIETSGTLQDGYLIVGTTYASNGVGSRVYLTQYDKTLSIKRLDFPLSNGGSPMQGVTAAFGEAGDFYVLANEIRQNNMRDVVLMKLASDGSVIGTLRFGTFEGEDVAGSVIVLPDRRVAIAATLELATQSKIALMIVSPDGKFTF